VTTLSEETIDAKKTIPKAVSLIALIGGCLFILVAYVGHMVYPDYSSFANPDSAAFEIAVRIGGNMFSALFLAGMIVLCFASALSSHASVSRLLFAMGRDSVLPAKVFGHLNPRYKTPVYNILIVAGFSLSALFIDLVTAASFINFGALVAFTFVNLSVIFHYFIRQKKRSPQEAVRYFLLPLIGSLFNVWLWTNLNFHSLMLGIVWTLCGVVYLMVLTRMFTRRPPEMNFDDTEKTTDSSMTVT
jgi:putrescine importer